MENKPQLPEHIKEMLKEIAIKYNKSLDDVITDYEKFILLGNEKELFSLYDLWELAKLRSDDPFQLLQETLKKPRYKKATAVHDYNYIKKNDILIFNINSKELKDKNIYLLQINSKNRLVYLYGEYDKNFDCFILDSKLKKSLKRKNNIKIMGILVEIIKEVEV